MMRRDRSKFIGGSDVAAICGLSPYKTPLAVWAEKTGKAKNEVANKGAVYWGNKLESLVGREWVKASGIKTLARTKKSRLIQGDIPEFRGEIDFWTEDGTFLEVKTAGLRAAADWGPEDSDIIPMPYYCQIQHYMGIAGLDYCYICVLIGGQDFRHYRIERDEQFIDAIWDICTTFWADYVLTDVPPLTFLNGKDNALIGQLYPEATEDVHLADDEGLAHYAALVDLQTSERSIKKEIDEHKAFLKMEMGSASQLVNDEGSILATWKESSRKKTDWMLLALALLEKVPSQDERERKIQEATTTTTVRTFLAKKPRGNDNE